MSWEDTTYEKQMKKLFIENLGNSKGEELYIDYISIRNAMDNDNFFREIKGQEPSLTDHSEKHIQDVFEKAYKIIGEEEFYKLNAYNIYCLALMILFHDVGNIFKREGHEAREKIATIYNKYRSNSKRYRDERRTITAGASSHSGKTSKGNRDTLKKIKDSSIKGNKIKLRELASILRFSDELAEGKHRTCSFLLENDLYEEKSKIYHQYAETIDIEIDRELNRISMTYDINIPERIDSNTLKEIEELIKFTCLRNIKLDIERQYTKVYSEILKVFEKVTVQYNFSFNGIPTDMDLSSITLEDEYPIPGEPPLSLENSEKKNLQKYKNYGVEKIMEKIKKKVTNL